ncbi:hypothetical protein OAJ53_01910 [Pelagibacteraceae bacterium]|nr:hypothetical protein [Pelagibacteraceae bacterium]
MREFYLYAERPIIRTIKEAFIGFKIYNISKQDIKKNKLTNKNIFLVLNEEMPAGLNKVFFLRNNVVIFFSKKNDVNKSEHSNVKIFSGLTNINKLRDEIITFFVSKTFIYKDIKILEEKIINTRADKEAFLTSLEKDILILLFERKKIEKNFLLENVLKLRKDTETKTIESHLTRIRKKLLSINSDIEIISKDNVIYLID